MVNEPLTVVMKYTVRDFLAGLTIGIFGSLNFFGGWLFGNFDDLIKIFPNHPVVVYVSGWWIAPFLIYTITPLYKRRDGYTDIGSKILSFIFYSVGVCVSFIAVFLYIISQLDHIF